MIVKNILPAIIFILISVISLIVLSTIQKGNRKFERKPVMWYMLISLFLFFLIGLVGLLAKDSLKSTISLSQLIVLMFGTFHAWFLFSNFDWTDRKSFLPESLLTLALTTTVGLGFLSGLIFWDQIFAARLGYSQTIYKSILCLPVPYLLVRTYDFLLQIPQKQYVAWPFPEGTPPKLNLHESNVIYVYMNLYCQSEQFPEGIIRNNRCRMPRDASFGAFFQHFVKDYNQDSKNYPITQLQKDEAGRDIGWVFFGSRTERGQKRLLDPYHPGVGQVQEGDYILARRVLLGEAYRQEDAGVARFVVPPPATSQNDDIIFINEK